MATMNRPNATSSVAMGHLRAFVTLLVIAHHAVLAYHPYAPAVVPGGFAAPPLMWSAFPVVDVDKWRGIDLFVGFNDVFFMSLMFFLSGLFVWPSLARKGAATFARDRAKRLGVPFLASAALLAPLAYYPSYLQGGGGAGFAKEWLALPSWPAGPAWFLWVLLALGLVAAALTRFAPAWGDALGRLAGALERPAAFFGAMIGLGLVAYVPLATIVDPMGWWRVGPFFVQGSRALHYAVWFFAGVGVGAHGLERGLLAQGERLARGWPLWALASLFTYAIEIVAVVLIFAALSKGEAPSRALTTFANVGFVVTCAAACLGFLGVFVRFARPGRAWSSLSANAYGMYIVHYAFVSWLQYALLGVHASGAAKGSLVFAGAVALSWACAAGLRRVPAVSKLVEPSMARASVAAGTSGDDVDVASGDDRAEAGFGRAVSLETLDGDR